MSKVVHLSDDAHNKAKAFCKQHGLKMSDWVAALIEDAMSAGRTDPTIKVRAVAPPPPPPPQPMAIPTAAAVAVAPSNLPPKKKLGDDRSPRVSAPTSGGSLSNGASSSDALPPWAAPPFWASQKAQTK
jgi:hypothetical protein